MKPLIRFHSIVLSITTLLVFYLWSIVITITLSHPSLKVPIAALVSVGIYRLLLLAFKFLILEIRFVKKWVFGANYLEGLWVGFFIGSSNKVRYYIETFEQDFDSLIIRGKGFREEEGYFGSWISDNVNVDVKKGVLNYTYETDAIKNSFINPGLASFTFQRSGVNKAPTKLMGFSSDLFNPNKLKSYEVKISDKPDIGDIEELLKQAKKIYQENNYFISLDD